MLERVAKKSGRVCWATLVAEPDNPFDGNAGAVQIHGETIAYLSRTDAKRYQSRLRMLTEALRVPAKLIGGTRDKPSFGVLIDCRELEAMPKPKAARKKRPAGPRRPAVLILSSTARVPKGIIKAGPARRWRVPSGCVDTKLP